MYLSSYFWYVLHKMLSDTCSIGERPPSRLHPPALKMAASFKHEVARRAASQSGQGKSSARGMEGSKKSEKLANQGVRRSRAPVLQQKMHHHPICGCVELCKGGSLVLLRLQVTRALPPTPFFIR
eukprot:5677006-Amphidinium_carterae.1